MEGRQRADGRRRVLPVPRRTELVRVVHLPVQQSYSDGSIVNWSGPESSDSPAPAIEAKSSLGGGGGTSTLAIVALVVGALGVVVGGIALLSRGGRQLA